MIKFIIEIPLRHPVLTLTDLFSILPEISLHYDNENTEFLAWGDPIKNDGFEEGLGRNPEAVYIINNLYGHYYYILLNKKINEILIGSSLFSILPLYYHQVNDKITFSENAISLGKNFDLRSISRRFILETILFNYPLFNGSIIEGINLVPSNSYLKIANTTVRIVKHTRIEEYFYSFPEPWRRSVDKISDIFLESVRKYLPDEFYVHSLTGGFDGRTLTSAGMFYRKDFSCFSFGASNSKDTEIASQITGEAGIPFINIQLNSKYTVESSLDCGLEFIRQSSGTSSFARAHYLFAAKQLSQGSRYIVTGNFGSEILRAAHNPGVMIASNLYNLFNSTEPEKDFKFISKSVEFGYLKAESFKRELDCLMEDLRKLPCFDTEYKNLSRNQRFYIFVFEEIFRKYFGAEMINQFGYLKNRTPFLDIDFIKAVFKTNIAGIHSGFFEHNPLKRYKGQVLYAHIIRKTYPLFGGILTDKGYRPDDLLNFTGNLNILAGYLKRRIDRKYLDTDPFAVSEAFFKNYDYYRQISIDPELFNHEELWFKDSILSNEILFKVLSLSYLNNQLF